MKSKLIFILYFALAMVGTVTAQERSDCHEFRIGDDVDRYKASYKVLSATGQHATWDLSDIDLNDKKVNVKYVADRKYDNGISGIEHHGLSYYEVEQGRIWLRGFENNLSKVCYDMPELVLGKDVALGTEIRGYFNGYSLYSENIYSRIYGQYTYQVDGVGTLLLPSSDSLQNVTCVHIHKTTGQQYLKDMVSYDSLRVFVDSICPFNADSIAWHLASDSCLVETDVYKWYAYGYRYPIYETMESHVRGNKIGLTSAYYCPPDAQQNLNDLDNEKLRNKALVQDYAGGDKDRQSVSSRFKLSDGSYVDYRLDVSAVGKVNLSLSCSKKENVSCSLYTLDGMLLDTYDLGLTASRIVEMSLAPYSHGIYIVKIAVNNQSCSEKIAY